MKSSEFFQALLKDLNGLATNAQLKRNICFRISERVGKDLSGVYFDWGYDFVMSVAQDKAKKLLPAMIDNPDGASELLKKKAGVVVEKFVKTDGFIDQFVTELKSMKEERSE